MLYSMTLPFIYHCYCLLIISFGSKKKGGTKFCPQKFQIQGTDSLPPGVPLIYLQVTCMILTVIQITFFTLFFRINFNAPKINHFYG